MSWQRISQRTPSGAKVKATSPSNSRARLRCSSRERRDAFRLANKDRHPGISLALVDEIQANNYQPRRGFDEQALQELAMSIRANGIIQPLVVRKGANGGYQLIAGERRLRAAL